MGQTDLPKVFVNDPAETPDAEKWNDNFSFLNVAQNNVVLNGDFENAFAAGVPDQWTLSGAGAAAAQSSDEKHGDNAVQVTFGGAAAILSQSHTEFEFYAGRTMRAWCWVKTGVPSQARLEIADGVGSSQSAYHSGSGGYELLSVNHVMASTPTELTLRLRVESAGSAIFDVATLIDAESLQSFLPNVNDFGATKEVFHHIPLGHANTLGNYQVYRLASSAADRLALFRVPRDFTSIVNAVLVGIPDTTGGPQTVELTSNYAAAGEDATAVSESNPTQQYSYIANQMQEFDVSSVLTGIGAGDYVGILFDRQGAGFGDIDFIGLRFRYL